MKNRILRAVVVLIAIASQAGAGFKVWELEQRASTERGTADTFERRARQLTLGLSELRAALQAYVADGQNAEPWQKTAGGLHQSLGAQAGALRDLARSPDAQGAVEDAVELIASLGRTEARAREFIASAQRLSASDVVFSEAVSQTTRAAAAIDIARGHESVASATVLERMRVYQLYYLGSAAAVTLLALLLLLPVPRAGTIAVTESAGETDAPQPGSSLGIGHVAPAAPQNAPEEDEIRVALSATDADLPLRLPGAPPSRRVSLAATADLCVALARVQEPRELPAVLEQSATVLNAAGIVIWMPDGPRGALRPALAHGYQPLAVTRMGTIPADADNATAIAYRSRATQAVPADERGNGAVAAPLVTADGCSGVMSAELKSGSDIETARAAATIIAAQLATLISPTVPAAKGTV